MNEWITKLELMVMKYAGEDFQNVELKDDTNLIDDLGYESINLVELMIELEQELGIDFDEVDELIEAFDTFGSLKNLIEKNLKKRS